jgi:hypothetical protein
VTDRNDERAPGPERPGELHLQAPFVLHVLHHERAAATQKLLVELVRDLDPEASPRLVGDAARCLGGEHPLVRVVEEEHGGVGAHGGRCGREDRAADLLDRAGLGAQPRDRSQDLELANALRARGPSPEALPAAPRGERGPDRGGEEGRDHGDREERGGLHRPTLTQPQFEQDDLLDGGADEQESCGERERGCPGEAPFLPEPPQQERAESEQRDSEPEEEPGDDVHGA